MKNDNQRVALTKRLLQEGLLRLLKTKPLEKVNITELCREAGINRATFYRHYELPKDILTQMQKDVVGEIDKKLGTPRTKEDLEAFFRYVYENADILKLFIKYNSDDDWIKLFGDFSRKSAVAGRLKDFDEESRRLVYTYVAGGGYFILRQWLTENIEKTPTEMANIILRIINKETLF